MATRLMLVAIAVIVNFKSISQAALVNSSWLTQTNISYQLMSKDVNNTINVTQEWSIQFVHDKLLSLTPPTRYDRDNSTLEEWMKYLDSNVQHEETNSNMTTGQTYIRTSQCRRCVADNLSILQSSELPSIADYAPIRIMKWCSSQSVGAINTSDTNGYCIPADMSCPIYAIDMNLLDQSTCPNDMPQTKLTCASCTNDAFVWMVDDKDTGSCVSSANHLSDNNASYVSHFNQCPEVKPSNGEGSHHCGCKPKPSTAKVVGIVVGCSGGMLLLIFGSSYLMDRLCKPPPGTSTGGLTGYSVEMASFNFGGSCDTGGSCDSGGGCG